MKEHFRLVPRLLKRNKVASVQISNYKGVPVFVGFPVVPKPQERHREVTTLECEKLKQKLFCSLNKLNHKKESEKGRKKDISLLLNR